MEVNNEWTYELIGRDVSGRRVYTSYLFDDFRGYSIYRTKREVKQLRKKEHQLTGIPEHFIGIPEWVVCPPELIEEESVKSQEELFRLREKKEALEWLHQNLSEFWVEENR